MEDLPKGKFRIIVVYDPTKVEERKIQNCFWNDLQNACDTSVMDCFIISLSDRIGNKMDNSEDILGNFG